MATRRLSRGEKQQQTRAAILRAAETLFAKKGVEGTSLEEIARHAGLTQGAIYSNFASKADLWWAIADHRSRTIDAEGIFRGDRPLAEELREFGAKSARLARDVARIDFLLDQEFYLFAQRHAAVRRRVGREIQEADEEFGRTLERHAAERDERLPLPGKQLSLLIVSMGRGLLFQAMFQPDVIDEDAFAEAFALLAGAD
jgi:AcrR family transcriptional regulator